MTIDILKLLGLHEAGPYFIPRNGKKLARFGVFLFLEQEDIGNLLEERFGGRLVYSEFY